MTPHPKLIEPSRLLIGQKPLRYVSALNTDIRRTFRRARLMAYSRGFPGGKSLREKFQYVASLADIEGIATEHLEQAEAAVLL